MFKNDNANIVDGKTNKQMGTGKSRSRKEVTRDSKGKKNEILWTYHAKGGTMLGKGDHSRHGSGRSGKGKTEDQLDGEYRGVKKFCITQILYRFSTSIAIISNLF